MSFLSHSWDQPTAQTFDASNLHMVGRRMELTVDLDRRQDYFDLAVAHGYDIESLHGSVFVLVNIEHPELDPEAGLLASNTLKGYYHGAFRGHEPRAIDLVASTIKEMDLTDPQHQMELARKVVPLVARYLSNKEAERVLRQA